MVTTEATYPFHWGGLSTWCHMLLGELSEIEFSLIAVSADPFARSQFELPPNVVDFRAVPLWGLRNAWELDRRIGARRAHGKRRKTTVASVREEFLPQYRTLLGQLLGAPRDDGLLAGALHGIYRYCLEHDFDRSFRSKPVWDALVEEVGTRYPEAAEKAGCADARISLAEITAASQWLYHWLFPLSQRLPEVEVAHATMAGLCSLLAIVSKLEYGAGFLLSEHGIYLRECYLAEHASSGSFFGKMLKLTFARRMTEIAYASADVVAPCCDYNHRWETQIGVDRDRIRTAYYGVDPQLYTPQPRPLADEPVIAWAGRIDPLKDVETLLRAAARVRDSRPGVRFRLYGAAPPGNERYNERCLALWKELHLEETVSFEGFTNKVLEAFTDSDVVVLSSISEGFPYSTLEAMLCGKPIVATAVGGMAEQVTPECGRVVRPRDPEALAEAILEVIASPEECESLAAAARERAAALFSIERFRTTHRLIYALVAPRVCASLAPSGATTDPVTEPSVEPDLVKPRRLRDLGGDAQVAQLVTES